MSTLYATLADLQTRYGEEINQVADRDGDGLADPAVVGGVLADVSAEIDSYLATRYTLPLAAVPLLLTRLACAIARERLALASGMVLDQNQAARIEADAARKTLKALSDGSALLGVQPEPAQPTAGMVQMTSGGRVWSRTATGDDGL
jgi:phage gp36-like protein